MPRRFLTAEDVRRAGSGPLEVAPETVVTPHARQVAEELGVRLVTGVDKGGFAVGPANFKCRFVHLPIIYCIFSIKSSGFFEKLFTIS